YDETEYRDDEDEGAYRERPRYQESRPNGAVTAVAVLNFLLGGLCLICGVISFIVGALATGVGDAASREPSGRLGGALLTSLGIVLIILAGGYVLLGIGGIVAGVGVTNRRQWGRILTLVLGGLAALLALVSLVSVFMGNVPGIITVFLFGG